MRLSSAHRIPLLDVGFNQTVPQYPVLRLPHPVHPSHLKVVRLSSWGTFQTTLSESRSTPGIVCSTSHQYYDAHAQPNISLFILQVYFSNSGSFPETKSLILYFKDSEFASHCNSCIGINMIGMVPSAYPPPGYGGAELARALPFGGTFAAPPTMLPHYTPYAPEPAQPAQVNIHTSRSS